MARPQGTISKGRPQGREDKLPYATDINLFAQVLTVADYGDTAKLIQIGEKYKFCFTSFVDAPHITTLKTLQSGMPCVLFTNPYFGWGDEFWTTPERLAQAITDFALRETDNDILYYFGQGTVPLMDIESATWLTEFKTEANEYVDSSGADGVFLDTISEDIPSWAVIPETPAGYTAAGWAASTITFATDVIAAVSPDNTYVNTGTRPPGQALPIPNAGVRALNQSGETIEAFGVALPMDGSDSLKWWYWNETCKLDVVALNPTKKVFLEATGSDDNETTRIYALCGYLLVQNANTYYTYTTVANHGGDQRWYPEFGTPLGNPTGAFSQDAGGLFVRDFDTGKVLLNGTAGALGITIASGYRNWDNTPVGTSITVPAYEAMLLTNA